MNKFRLQRIDLYCPEYKTDATIHINEEHQSGLPHLEADYKKGGYKGQFHFASGIPEDWTDRDLFELFSLPPRQGDGARDWPAWEIPARDYGRPVLYRFWKGEQPPGA